jgi:transposase-like protein
MQTEYSELNLVEIAAKYADEDKARAFLESILWPNGPVCPHCSSTEAYRLTPKAGSKSPARKGLCKCKACRKQFTVTVGTIFSDSHIPIGKWLMAIFLLCSSKKAISAHQLHRSLGMTYKAAWFMAHRIRYAMSDGPLAELLKGTVEVDETYVGGKTKGMGRAYKGNKTPVVSLVQRNGIKRSMVMERVTAKNLRKAVKEHVHSEAQVMTDDSPLYVNLPAKFNRQSVCHSAGEYVRGEVHTNTVESSFSLLKRGVVGAFHHVSAKHLGRYLSEFDFRWNSRKNTDGERTILALGGFVGKRLTYRDSSQEGKIIEPS